MDPALQQVAALVGNAPRVPGVRDEQLSKANREPVPSSATIKAPDFSHLHFSNRELLTAHSAPLRRLGGRVLGPDIKQRAVARYRSRRFTCAKCSPSVLINLQPSLEIRARKGGTVNRPFTRVTHRKQTVEHMQGRNVPVHSFCAHFNRPAIAHNPLLIAASQPNASLYYESRRLIRAMCSDLLSANQKSADIDQAFLPETANRVETGISHRKQMVAHAATRDWVNHSAPPRIVEFTFVMQTAIARAVPPVCLDAEQSARCISQFFSRITNHESLITKSPLANHVLPDAIINFELHPKGTANATKRIWA